LAWVDHLFRRDTESAVARAVELAPGNAEYHTRLAALHQDAGRDAAAIESELRATVQMNPRMSGAWIELGLRAETAGEASQGEAVNQRGVALGGDRDLDAVLDYCDGLMAAGDADHAIRAWNAVCWRTLHSYHPLAPLTSPGLTNSDFASTPIQRGSDWRMPLSGVDVERGGLPPPLGLTPDGRQP